MHLLTARRLEGLYLYRSSQKKQNCSSSAYRSRNKQEINITVWKISQNNTNSRGPKQLPWGTPGTNVWNTAGSPKLTFTLKKNNSIIRMISENIAVQFFFKHQLKETKCQHKVGKISSKPTSSLQVKQNPWARHSPFPCSHRRVFS